MNSTYVMCAEYIVLFLFPEKMEFESIEIDHIRLIKKKKKLIDNCRKHAGEMVKKQTSKQELSERNGKMDGIRVSLVSSESTNIIIYDEINFERNWYYAPPEFIRRT